VLKARGVGKEPNPGGNTLLETKEDRSRAAVSLRRAIRKIGGGPLNAGYTGKSEKNRTHPD